MSALVSLILFCVWVCGVVIANGFWSTFFALIFPFWGYYLVAEQLLIRFLL